MWYLILGFVAGVVLTATPFIIWLRKARSGELQVYAADGETYTTLRISSKQVFEKKYLLLKTTYVSEEEFLSRD